MAGRVPATLAPGVVRERQLCGGYWICGAGVGRAAAGRARRPGRSFRQSAALPQTRPGANGPRAIGPRVIGEGQPGSHRRVRRHRVLRWGGGWTGRSDTPRRTQPGSATGDRRPGGIVPPGQPAGAQGPAAACDGGRDCAGGPEPPPRRAVAASARRARPGQAAEAQGGPAAAQGWPSAAQRAGRGQGRGQDPARRRPRRGDEDQEEGPGQAAQRKRSPPCRGTSARSGAIPRLVTATAASSRRSCTGSGRRANCRRRRSCWP